MHVCLFPTLTKREGESTFHDGKEKNLQQGKTLVIFVSQNFLSMTDACCSLFTIKQKRLVKSYWATFTDTQNKEQNYVFCRVQHLPSVCLSLFNDLII